MKFLLTILIWGFIYMSSAQANGLPKEITQLEDAFNSVLGVTDVGIGKHQFSNNEIKNLDKVFYAGEYADLPIAMLRRTNGNLDKELLITVEFKIESNLNGLKALEFLSWWVRDLSRAGDNVQIRTIGLPPIAGDQVQLGNTLRFWFEAYIQTEEDISLVLKEIAELTESLNENVDLYKSARD